MKQAWKLSPVESLTPLYERALKLQRLYHQQHHWGDDYHKNQDQQHQHHSPTDAPPPLSLAVGQTTLSSPHRGSAQTETRLSAGVEPCALRVEAKLIINGRASAFLKSYSEDLLRVYPQANSDIEIQKHTALLVSLYLWNTLIELLLPRCVCSSSCCVSQPPCLF